MHMRLAVRKGEISVAVAAKAILRRVLTVRSPKRRLARHALRVLRTESELAAAAILLARSSRTSPRVIRDRLGAMFVLDTSVLYVQIDGGSRPCEVVFTSSAGNRIAAAWRGGRLETELEEPAADGAYLTERQYRQLGFYEVPPNERAVVMLHFEGSHGSTCVVDVPRYVEHVTLAVDGHQVVRNAVVPPRGDLRYRIG